MNKIPSTFQLLNYTWTVVLTDGPVPNDENKTLHGNCDHDARVITLNGQLDPEMLGHTWLHEVLHAILTAIGRERLSKDEGFVDAVSGALAQVLQTGATKSSRSAARRRSKPALT